MSGEPPRYLEELTIQKLKAVAQASNIDVSSCKHKKDFVDALATAGLTEDQVRGVLADAEGKDDVSEAVKDVEAIAERPRAARDMPSAEYAEVERNIDRTLMVRPSLFDIDSSMEYAWDRMLMGDFREAMKLNKEAREKMLDRLSSLQIYSSAMSIRASETILASIESSGGKVDPRLRTALAEAKKAFVEGSPKRREETLEELELLTTKAFDAYFEDSTKAEEELRLLLSDYESFGTQTQESRRVLEIAEQARRAFNVSEYATLLTHAKDSAERAKSSREWEIRRALEMAKAAVQEAKEVGGALSVGEKELEEAKEAIEKQAFKRAVDLMSSVEREADKAHEERVRDRELRASQVQKVNAAIANWGPALQEAAQYGLDAQEGLLFVRSARIALDRKDVVSAAKFARRLKQVSGPVSEELDRKRVELGIASKVEGAKCGKCGKESLYVFPNNLRKCIGCGHSFALTPPSGPAAHTLDHIEKPVSKSSQMGEGGNAAAKDAKEKK